MQTIQTTKETFLGFFAKKLAAGANGNPGQPVRVAVVGNFFLCTRVVGGEGLPFLLQFDDQPPIPWNMGLDRKLVPGNFFSTVTLTNPTNSEIIVEFYAGSGVVEDSRLNIVRDPNHIQIITQYPAPNYAVREYPLALPEVAENPDNLLVLPGILLRGTWPCAPAANWLYALPVGVNRAQRKSLRIESDESLDLLWWNGLQANLEDGVKLASVPLPGTTVPFYEETSQDLVLVNPGAAAATLAVLALYDVPVWYSPTSEDP